MWIEQALEQLRAATVWSYLDNQPTAAEPAALAAIALLAHGDDQSAERPLNWLAAHQRAGFVGVTGDQNAPMWPTSLAIMAWSKAESVRFRENATRGVSALLSIAGKPLERTEEAAHDTTLIGWPWVDGTHSWVEPTALAVIALKAAGFNDYPRTREAVRLLIDRMLTDGGCNYGNTIVLGQELRPHLQPSGIALAALADEQDVDGRIARTIDYLQQSLTSQTATASLSYALIGLGAHDVLPSQASEWLAAAAKRTLSRDRSSYKLALLAIAEKASDQPLSTIAREIAAR